MSDPLLGRFRRAGRFEAALRAVDARQSRRRRAGLRGGARARAQGEGQGRGRLQRRPPPHNFAFLAALFPLEAFSEARAEEVFATAEVLVVLDMQNKERLGRVARYADRPGLVTAILDHHVGDAAFGQVNVVAPEKAATGELVYDWLKRDRASLTAEMAKALYTALVTDTGSFRHSNTDPDVHAMAAHLLELGVESASVQAEINRHRHMGRLRFVGHLLQGLKTSEDGAIAWFEVTPDLFTRYDVDGSDTEGLVDFPRTGSRRRGRDDADRPGQRARQGEPALRRAGSTCTASRTSLGGGGTPLRRGHHARGHACEARAKMLRPWARRSRRSIPRCAPTPRRVRPPAGAAEARARRSARAGRAPGRARRVRRAVVRLGGTGRGSRDRRERLGQDDAAQGRRRSARPLARLDRVARGARARSSRTTRGKGLGFVSPELGLYEDLSARENLAFFAGARGLAGAMPTRSAGSRAWDLRAAGTTGSPATRAA
jgi:hypothetical protein